MYGFLPAPKIKGCFGLPNLPGWQNSACLKLLGKEVHKDTKILFAIMIGLVVAAVAVAITAGQLPHWMHHEGLVEAEAKLHHIHVGLYQAVLIYISIAFTIFAFVSFWIGLLTALKFDKERTETVTH